MLVRQARFCQPEVPLEHRSDFFMLACCLKVLRLELTEICFQL